MKSGSWDEPLFLINALSDAYGQRNLGKIELMIIFWFHILIT